MDCISKAFTFSVGKFFLFQVSDDTRAPDLSSVFRFRPQRKTSLTGSVGFVSLTSGQTTTTLCDNTSVG